MLFRSQTRAGAVVDHAGQHRVDRLQGGPPHGEAVTDGDHEQAHPDGQGGENGEQAGVGDD